MLNFMEQFVAEWYELRHYFVRRNVKVGKRPKGGWESELDVVAFNPAKRHLVHIEPSMDAGSWQHLEGRFAAKFAAGQKFIPSLFPGLTLPEPEQIAIVAVMGKKAPPTLGGGKVLSIMDFMNEVRSDPEWGLAHRPFGSMVPEQYVILRSLQYAAHYWKAPLPVLTGLS
jgi:hypothetical protein